MMTWVSRNQCSGRWFPERSRRDERDEETEDCSSHERKEGAREGTHTLEREGLRNDKIDERQQVDHRLAHECDGLPRIREPEAGDRRSKKEEGEPDATELVRDEVQPHPIGWAEEDRVGVHRLV